MFGLNVWKMSYDNWLIGVYQKFASARPPPPPPLNFIKLKVCIVLLKQANVSMKQKAVEATK